MPRFLGVLAYPILGLVAGVLIASTPQPAPLPPNPVEGYVSTLPAIVASEGAWSYPVPEIVVLAPTRHRTVAVVNRVAPAPRADLGVVYSAGSSVIGAPYAAGGETPDGFDCSGFISWAYAQAGVALPITTSGIKARGTVISAADAQPGDILYWPGHVALYAGPGLRLDSNRPGSSVAVRAIYGSPKYLRIG